MNKRIRELRKKLGLTQQEFADRIGIKRGAITNYEIGRNAPIDAVVTLICREFNVNEQWLREGTGEMFRVNQNDKLEIIMRQHNLDDDEVRLVKNFIDLDPSTRKKILEYMETFIGLYKKNKEQ